MKWEKSEDVHSVGLYRSSKFGARYIFVNEENVGINEGYLGDVRTMKHLVAQHLGKTLISFSEYTNELTVPLGCDLPCLYERAIVVQSGDSEGNDFRNTANFTLGTFVPNSTWEGQLYSGTKYEEIAEYEGIEEEEAKEIVKDGKICICFWPAILKITAIT